jgi:hypothetical protein
MEKVIEVGNKNSEGAKINLTIDLAPVDCYIMCKQLFDKLKSHEKAEIVEAFNKELEEPEHK